ncbi:MAG: MFS transporter [Myxococcales bacterium]|nr:MFS transporter [Myxococcales bacterium]
MTGDGGARLTRYQMLVLGAAWLGWGFDAFDGILFNFVSALCVPSLLGIPYSDPRAKPAIVFWTGALSSVLLVGWAVGGVMFGRLTDQLGRTRTMLITMLVYAIGTAACAFAPNMAVFAILRFVVALGIGGEWAAGAALVAETMPEKKRVLGGALLYTSAPAGFFLATFVTDLFTRQLGFFARNPELAWRAVFLTGAVPAVFALLIRMKLKEPEDWKPQVRPKLRELFAPALCRATLSGLVLAFIAMCTWWSCYAFIPMIARFLTDELPIKPSGVELAKLKASFVTLGTSAFNLGGIVGTLLTVPIATRLGRRPMFLGFFLASALAIWVAFALPLPPEARLYSLFFVGLTVFGVFGSFTFYLPELFPMRLRGTGAGFCYNSGRVITALFPFGVSLAAQSGTSPLEIIRWAAILPVLGALAVVSGLAVETRERVFSGLGRGS